jgi:hypothetical protein
VQRKPPKAFSQTPVGHPNGKNSGEGAQAIRSCFATRANQQNLAWPRPAMPAKLTPPTTTPNHQASLRPSRAPQHSAIARLHPGPRLKPALPTVMGISGLVVEYIVAIDVTRVRFPAGAFSKGAVSACGSLFSFAYHFQFLRGSGVTSAPSSRASLHRCRSAVASAWGTYSCPSCYMLRNRHTGPEAKAQATALAQCGSLHFCCLLKSLGPSSVER